MNFPLDADLVLGRDDGNLERDELSLLSVEFSYSVERDTDSDQSALSDGDATYLRSVRQRIL